MTEKHACCGGVIREPSTKVVLSAYLEGIEAAHPEIETLPTATKEARALEVRVEELETDRGRLLGQLRALDEYNDVYELSEALEREWDRMKRALAILRAIAKTATTDGECAARTARAGLAMLGDGEPEVTP